MSLGPERCPALTGLLVEEALPVAPTVDQRKRFFIWADYWPGRALRATPLPYTPSLHTPTPRGRLPRSCRIAPLKLALSDLNRVAQAPNLSRVFGLHGVAIGPLGHRAMWPLGHGAIGQSGDRARTSSYWVRAGLAIQRSVLRILSRSEARLGNRAIGPSSDRAIRR